MLSVIYAKRQLCCVLYIERTEEVGSKSQKSILFIGNAYVKTLVLQKVLLLFWPEAAASKVRKTKSIRPKGLKQSKT